MGREMLQRAPGKTELPWEYCECGCLGLELRVPSTEYSGATTGVFWLYDALTGGPKALTLAPTHADWQSAVYFADYKSLEKQVREELQVKVERVDALLKALRKLIKTR